MTSKLQDIFRNAIALAGAEREAFLRGACGDDRDMRAELDGLLLAHDTSAMETLDAHAASSNASAPLREGPGSRIGPYKLLQLIGEGGFGSVFMAEQERPVVRKVALKIIKLGMDTRQVVARFEQERQALAMMDHPNIARVLDAGATETGRPFFVMELVKGEPIVEYCDKNSLSVTARLELFEQACNAVQHAHTKGIIHRDIKPSNILVSTQDGRPSAKVIDFGIAKATASKLTERTLFTEHRQLIGTPEYMSPEQAEGNLDVDTRTDVYSLGVLLYELLTGTTPFSSKDLRSAAFGEIQRIIREVEPPNPSTRLSQSTDSIAAIAAKRQSDARRLGVIIRGELDWIVMKALEKDRQRRYETANGLAQDVRRCLSGEAVLAAPPSKAYRLRKFVRRHRRTVTAAALVASVLVLGIIGTSVGLVWALNEQTRADKSAARAILAQDEALARSRELEKVVAFQSAQLAGVDVMQMGVRLRQDLLNAVRQAGEQTQTEASAIDASVAAVDLGLAQVDFTGIALSTLEANIFKPAIEAIRGQFADQPVVRADLLMIVSDTLRELGALALAERPALESVALLTAELGPRDVKTLQARFRRGVLLKDLGKLDDSKQELDDCLAQAVSAHGTDSEIAMRVRMNLGTTMFDLGMYAECVELFRPTLAWFREHIGPLDVDTLGCMTSLAASLSGLERFDEAEPLYRESVEGFRKGHGASDARSINALNNFAGHYRYRKDYPRALEVFGEALKESRQALGDDHWLTLMIVDNLGGVRYSSGDIEGAIVLARAALDGRTRVLGANHPATLRSCFNVAVVLQGRPDTDEAVALYRRALAGFRLIYGENHGHTFAARNMLNALLMKRKDFKDSEALLLDEIALLDARTGASAGASAGASSGASASSIADASKSRKREVMVALGTLYEAWNTADPNDARANAAAEWKARLDEKD